MKKQMGILLLVLAVAVGFSGAVAAANGNMTQTPTDSQWMKSGHSMWMKYMNWMNMWWMKMMAWMNMLMMGRTMPVTTPLNMPMNTSM